MIICCELLFMVLIIPLTMIILFKLNQIQIFVIIVECLIQLELAGPLSSNLKPSTNAVSDVLTQLEQMSVILEYDIQRRALHTPCHQFL